MPAILPPGKTLWLKNLAAGYSLCFVFPINNCYTSIVKRTLVVLLLVICITNAKAQLSFDALKQYTTCFDLACVKDMALKQGFAFADSSHKYAFTHYVFRADTLPANALNGRSMDFVFGILGATLTYKTDNLSEYNGLVNGITTAGYTAAIAADGTVEGSKDYTYTKTGATDIKITTYHKEYGLSLHRYDLDNYVIRIRP